MTDRQPWVRIPGAVSECVREQQMTYVNGNAPASVAVVVMLVVLSLF